jgi:tellurite resistance protein
MRTPPHTNPSAMLQLRYACVFAWADGRLQPSERQAIEEACFAFDLTAEEQAEVERWLEKRPAMPEPGKVEPTRRPGLLRLAQLVSQLDGEVQSEERELFEALHRSWQPGPEGEAPHAPVVRTAVIDSPGSGPMRVLQFACTFAWADGRILPGERRAIEALCDRFDLPAEEVARVERWLESRPPQPTDPARVPAEQRPQLLELVQMISSADGELQSEERALAAALRRAWGPSGEPQHPAG